SSARRRRATRRGCAARARAARSAGLLVLRLRLGLLLLRRRRVLRRRGRILLGCGGRGLGGAEPRVVAAHDLVGDVGGGRRVEQRFLLDDEVEALALAHFVDDGDQLLADAAQRLVFLSLKVALHLVGGLLRLHELLLQLLLLLL